MTTGRINQVTILSPRGDPGEARAGYPPKGAELVTRRGEAEPRPAVGAGCASARLAARGHSIAPTEFPKGRSAAGSIRALRPPYAAA
jgi:hypothetical protein